jgi:cysteine desulfurase
MDGPIYLDHNATSPMSREVAEAVREASLRWPANPESQHQPGREARRRLESARERIAELMGCRTMGRTPDRVLFTSGGTEANHLALVGLAGYEPTEAGRRLVISPIEHPSITQTALWLASRGFRVDSPPVNQQGVVETNGVSELLGPEVLLASVILANNETGVLQPVDEIARLCAAEGIPLHTDATQAVGKIPVDFTGLCVAALTMAAHKFQGPRGIGALVVRHEFPLRPTFFGGHQQGGMRPGTECVALVVGMEAALEEFVCEADKRMERVGRLRDELENRLLAEIPFARVVGANAPRLPNTLNLALVGLDRQAVVMALDLESVASSTGSACASGSSEPSPTLLAMGVEPGVLESSIRLSLGPTTTAAEVDEAACRILKVCKRLRSA